MRAIAAMDLNRVIGNMDNIPWKISDDLKFFKKMTTDPNIGGFLVMGSRTFSVVGPLPGRMIYVLSGIPDSPHTFKPTHRYVTPDEFLTLDLPWNRIWVCGGAKTYQTLLPFCKEVYLTIVLDEYEGDVYMPKFEDEFSNSEILKETKTYWIVKYTK